MNAAGDVRPPVDERGGGEEKVEEKEEKGEQVEAEDEPAEAGIRKPIKMNDPKEPSEEERRQHNLTHLPYRSWCKHCVGGRGKEAPHRRRDYQGELPELHLDYAFMGNEGEAGKTITLLMAR